MRKIAASILGKNNKSELINMLIEKGIEYVHYDVMDGKFVPRHSMPVNEIEEIIKTTNKHYIDIHLMVVNPKEYIEKFIGKVDQISAHIETIENPGEFIKQYAKRIKLGLVVNPETDIRKTFPFLKDLNHVMIMSVNPGKGGQSFIENSLDKIRLLKEEINKNDYKVIIEIDGGINDKWGPIVFDNGINLAVSGSYLTDNIENGSIAKILGE
ncbi:MAG: ribulose-phosphate 3-epimerase [Mycoplasmatales bacterium]|nr:ribulose-phosphate 3-epimerase [Mycoplasmatales bacterium]